MHLSEIFSVPDDTALLYDFVNSLDQRRYVEQGITHVADDALATPAQLETWLRERNLLAPTQRLDAGDHRQALALRDALRSFLALTPRERVGDAAVAASLNAAAAEYPLTVQIGAGEGIVLRPSSHHPASGLGHVVAALQRLAGGGRLDRVKMCDSDECGWIFYDRSKPGNRRWCSSALCGNREKTRTYRSRLRHG
jgi:predicted RNA-binding Zn ribbon-like protein